MVTEDRFSAARREHLRLALRALRRHAGGCVVSDETAAIAHRLPTYRVPAKTRLTRPTGSRRSTGRTDVSVAALPAGHVVRLEGMGDVLFTSMARTVVDIARRRPFLEALVTADAALRRGLSRERLEEVLAQMPRWPGVVAAAEVVRWADGRAESAAESVVRARFILLGLPVPDLQVWVQAGGGRRVDFLWEEVDLVGEVDGRVKYAGEDGDRVLWEEKERRDAIEEERSVIRWTWRQAHAADDEFRTRFWRAWRRAERLRLTDAATPCAPAPDMSDSLRQFARGVTDKRAPRPL